ncbi:hypothetical protein [Selenomonas ruminantium]|uniref:hypothetical protein n=1 Tax=Selenomonas ruminantium TaxID=971 RepID=UPI0015A506D4|nr:hypothetical protein [Selenomonas ruminantium]
MKKLLLSCFLLLVCLFGIPQAVSAQETGFYGYQRKFAVDLQLQLFWDQDAKWFGIRRL